MGKCMLHNWTYLELFYIRCVFLFITKDINVQFFIKEELRLLV